MALGTGPYSVPAPYRGPAPGLAPGPGSAPGTGPGIPAPARTLPPRSGAPGSRRKPAAAGRRGLLAAAAAVGLAGTVTAAILLYPGSGEPGQASGARTAATQATSPGAPAPGTGEAAREPAGGTAVKGKPVPFTIPGRVPAVAVSFRADGSLITVGTNGTVYTRDMAARQPTSEIPAPRGHAFQRAAVSPDGNTTALQDSSGVAYVRAWTCG